MENLAEACALQSQEADRQDGTAETRQEEGIHDSTCSCKKLLSLVISDHSEQVYAMRAEETVPSSLMSGEKSGLNRHSALPLAFL
jgi:hypothetical protein